MDHPQIPLGIVSNKPGQRYPYSGHVQVGGTQYAWRQREGSEIELTEMPPRTPYKPLSEMHFSDSQELHLVNALLAQYRRHAMPDENGYYAASAVVTEQGNLFLSANNEVHIKDPYSGRGCAETSALRKCQDGLHKPDVVLSRVYLMSGQAEKRDDGSLKEKKGAHVGCLCGECRDNLRPHSNTGTRYVMLPANDGSMSLQLNARARSPDELNAGEAWAISFNKMYPVPEKITVGGRPLAEVVKRGYLHITDMAAAPLPLDVAPTPLIEDRGDVVTITRETLRRLEQAQRHVSTSMPALEADGSLANINKAMLQLVKQAYAEHGHKIPAGKNLQITVVILKSNDGKFYPGVSVVGEGWITSLPAAAPTGLNNALSKRGFSDVYMMTFDSQQHLDDMAAANAGVYESRVSAPNAAALNRVIKKLSGSDQANITLVPINDGTLTSEEIQKYATTLNIREVFGPGFSNPKETPTVPRH